MKPKTKPRHYAKSVLTRESQFSFRNGSNSCTYIALEAALYTLHGLVFPDDPHLSDLIRTVLRTGVSMDAGVGNTSCEEAYASSERFGRLLEAGNLVVAKLRDPQIFTQLLRSMVQKTENQLAENQRKNEPLHRKSVAVILTKPPETIALFYVPPREKENSPAFPFIIFDSHPRMFEPDRGAGFYFFRDMASCCNHLAELYRDSIHSAQQAYKEQQQQQQQQQHLQHSAASAASFLPPEMNEYEVAARACFDATFVLLKEGTEFEEPPIFAVGSAAVAAPVAVLAQQQQQQQSNGPVASVPPLSQPAASDNLHSAVPQQQLSFADNESVQLRDTANYYFMQIISGLKEQIRQMQEELDRERQVTTNLQLENAALRTERDAQRIALEQIAKLAVTGGTTTTDNLPST